MPKVCGKCEKPVNRWLWWSKEEDDNEEKSQYMEERDIVKDIHYAEHEKGSNPNSVGRVNNTLSSQTEGNDRISVGSYK